MEREGAMSRQRRRIKLASDIAIEDFYALRLRRIATHMAREHFSFWMICCYLLFEYVRPQAILPSIDVAPWPSIFLGLALAGRVVDRDTKWVSDPANLLMSAFMVVFLAASITAVYPDWAWIHFQEMLSWFVVYFLVVNTVTTERRLLIFVGLFLVASYKLSFFGARTWIMRGFSFEPWGIQGPHGFFMNSGELTVQMLMFAPVAYYLAVFLRPHISRLKFALLMTMPITAALTVLGASSRGSQLGLAYQSYRVFLRERLTLKSIAIVAAAVAIGWNLLPAEQKERFSAAGSDSTSVQRLLYWKHGLEMIRDHPVLGVGPNNFPPYYEDHWPEDMLMGSTQVPHNIFIQVGTDVGVTGLLLFVALIWRSFSISRSVRAMALDDKPFGALANGFLIGLWGFLISGQFVTIAYYPFFWINLAMTVALGSIARRSQQERRSEIMSSNSDSRPVRQQPRRHR
jgi:O-antigen ligase